MLLQQFTAHNTNLLNFLEHPYQVEPSKFLEVFSAPFGFINLCQPIKQVWVLGHIFQSFWHSVTQQTENLCACTSITTHRDILLILSDTTVYSNTYTDGTAIVAGKYLNFTKDERYASFGTGL